MPSGRDLMKSYTSISFGEKRMAICFVFSFWYFLFARFWASVVMVYPSTEGALAFTSFPRPPEGAGFGVLAYRLRFKSLTVTVRQNRQIRTLTLMAPSFLS